MSGLNCMFASGRVASPQADFGMNPSVGLSLSGIHPLLPIADRMPMDRSRPKAVLEPCGQAGRPGRHPRVPHDRLQFNRLTGPRMGENATALSS
jgi:hypothetical protein